MKSRLEILVEIYTSLKSLGVGWWEDSEGEWYDRDRRAELLELIVDGLVHDYQKREEYRQVAGLVCLDLDILKDMVEIETYTREDLARMVIHTHELKEELIANPEVRKNRYETTSILFSIPKEGSDE